MEQYVALDVSLKEISVCVIDGKGAVTFEGKVAAEPAALISVIRSKAPQPARVGLETGALPRGCTTRSRRRGCLWC